MAAAIFRAFRNYKNEMEGNKNNTFKDDTLYSDYKEELRKDSIQNPLLTHDSAKTSDNSPLKTNNDSTNNNILYKIQFYVSSRPVPLNSKIFDDIPDVEETKDGKVYKYTSGKAATYDEMQANLKKVREKYKDAFTVQYKNGVKVNMNNNKKKK